jgi:hypothetical protein
MTKQWYASVDKAFNKVFPLKKIKVKEDWWDEDCKVALQRYRSKYKSAHRRGRPSPAHLMDLGILNRTLKNCIKRAKKTRVQEYVSKVETLPAMAKLSKILRAKPSSKLGLVKKPDGSLCTSPEESLATMVREHFPGSVVTDTPASPPPRSTEVKVEPIPWITPDRTWAAINSFGPQKACGPDKLNPVVLQHLPWEAVEALSNIFTAVIRLGYVPTRWRASDVIFIDKPGKTDFENPRSFRPISLMSFVYKTLEKVVAMDLEQNALKENPMHEYQFGFVKGR